MRLFREHSRPLLLLSIGRKEESAAVSCFRELIQYRGIYFLENGVYAPFKKYYL